MRLAAEGARVELGGRAALKGASVDFRPGALTGVIGPNGAGKDDAPARPWRASCRRRREASCWTAGPSAPSTGGRRRAGSAISPKARGRPSPFAWTRRC